MKKTYLVGALMIGASMIFVRPIKAQANPTAGVIKEMEITRMEPPIAEWQKDILYYATDKNALPKEKKHKKKVVKKETINYIYASENTLNRYNGVFDGPSGKETYYNLSMNLVVQYMKDLGYSYNYWIRKDGVKMLGQYVMVAADLNIRPKGTIVPTSLGPGIVCDTGSFVKSNSCQLDVAVAW